MTYTYYFMCICLCLYVCTRYQLYIVNEVDYIHSLWQFSYEITVVCAWSGIDHRLARTLVRSAQSRDQWHSVAAFVS